MNVITIEDNFNLDQIMNSGQAFRITKLNDGFYQFIHLNYVLRIKNVGDNQYLISVSPDEWNSIWRDYFDLDTNYRMLMNEVSFENEFLQKAYEFSSGIRILKQDPFEMFISYIISQQNNIPKIKSTIERICQKYGSKIDEDIHQFPNRDQLINVNWREEFHVGYRDRYLSNFIENCNDEIYNYTDKSDQELFEFAKSFLGVGYKVASCILLFAYHRLGFVPKDVWINRIIANEFNGVDLFAKYNSIAGIIQQYAYYYARHREH